MTEVAERQFRVLADIAATLGAAGVPFWLRGGWALDFLVGRITREHADIDLVAHLEDRDAIYEALTGRGFTFDRELPDAAIDFEKSGESVQILLVERLQSGAFVTRGFETWPWPSGAFDEQLRELEGVACRTLSPHALLEEKENYERHRDRPLRDLDRASIDLLREMLERRL